MDNLEKYTDFKHLAECLCWAIEMPQFPTFFYKTLKSA
jgi:hypothetical protein